MNSPAVEVETICDVDAIREAYLGAPDEAGGGGHGCPDVRTSCGSRQVLRQDSLFIP